MSTDLLFAVGHRIGEFALVFDGAEYVLYTPAGSVRDIDLEAACERALANFKASRD